MPSSSSSPSSSSLPPPPSSSSLPCPSSPSSSSSLPSPSSSSESPAANATVVAPQRRLAAARSHATRGSTRHRRPGPERLTVAAPVPLLQPPQPLAPRRVPARRAAAARRVCRAEPPRLQALALVAPHAPHPAHRAPPHRQHAPARSSVTSQRLADDRKRARRRACSQAHRSRSSASRRSRSRSSSSSTVGTRSPAAPRASSASERAVASYAVSTSLSAGSLTPLQRHNTRGQRTPRRAHSHAVPTLAEMPFNAACCACVRAGAGGGGETGGGVSEISCRTRLRAQRPPAALRAALGSRTDGSCSSSPTRRLASLSPTPAPSLPSSCPPRGVPPAGALAHPRRDGTDACGQCRLPRPPCSPPPGTRVPSAPHFMYPAGFMSARRLCCDTSSRNSALSCVAQPNTRQASVRILLSPLRAKQHGGLLLLLLLLLLLWRSVRCAPPRHARPRPAPAGRPPAAAQGDLRLPPRPSACTARSPCPAPARPPRAAWP